MFEFVVISGIALVIWLLAIAKRSSGSVPSVTSQKGIVRASVDVDDSPSFIPSSNMRELIAEVWIAEVCRRENYFRPELAIAIARQESSLNPKAFNPETGGPRGDQPDSIGLMGLQFDTARKFYPGLNVNDLYDPLINATCGVRYISYLEGKWFSKYGLDGIIQMYNLGETRFLQGKRNSTYLLSVKTNAGYA